MAHGSYGVCGSFRLATSHPHFKILRVLFSRNLCNVSGPYGGRVICTLPETTQIIKVHVFLDKHIGVLGYIRVPLASVEITPFTRIRGCIELLWLMVSALVRNMWHLLELDRRRSSSHPPANKQLRRVCVCVLSRESKVEGKSTRDLHVNVVDKQVICLNVLVLFS